MTPQPDNHIQKSMSDSKDSLSYFRTTMPLLIPCMQQIKLDCILLAQHFGKGEGTTVAIYSHSLDAVQKKEKKPEKKRSP